MRWIRGWGLIFALAILPLGCASEPSYYHEAQPVIPAPHLGILASFAEHSETLLKHSEMLRKIEERYPRAYFSDQTSGGGCGRPSRVGDDFPVSGWGRVQSPRPRGVGSDPRVNVDVFSHPQRAPSEDRSGGGSPLPSPDIVCAALKYLGEGKHSEEDPDILRNIFDVLNPPSPADPISPYRPVKITVSATLDSPSPADRLDKIDVYILIDDGAKIVDSEGLATDWKNIVVGELTAGYTLGGGLDASGTWIASKDYTATPKPTFNATYNRNWQRTISRELLRRNVEICEDGRLVVLSQGGQAEMDISGNVTTTMTLQLNRNPAAMSMLSLILVGGETEWRSDDRPFLDNGDVNGHVIWVAKVRQVYEGGRTVLEDDDIIGTRILAGSKPITLWRNWEKIYLLGCTSKDPENFYPLCYQVAKGTPAPVPSPSAPQPEALADKNLLQDVTIEGTKISQVKRPSASVRFVAFSTLSEAMQFRDKVVKKYDNLDVIGGEPVQQRKFPIRIREKGKEQVDIGVALYYGSNEVNPWGAVKPEPDNLQIYIVEPEDYPLLDKRKFHM